LKVNTLDFYFYRAAKLTNIFIIAKKSTDILYIYGRVGGSPEAYMPKVSGLIVYKLFHTKS